MGIESYTGRSFDLLAYPGGTSRGSAQLTAALASETSSGQITTGIQKLAQRFLIELMTEKGSMTYLPLRGCDFMRDARLGYWRSVLDVMASFSASLIDIKQNLQAEESVDDDDDERFSDAEVVAVTLEGDSASITIRVTSLAGTDRTFITPLSITL